MYWKVSLCESKPKYMCALAALNKGIERLGEVKDIKKYRELFAWL